jgi:NTE family protein
MVDDMLALDQLEKKQGTALVLSGGATKAFYFHLGVLKALQPQDTVAIVGSSAGAVLGALFASGISIDTLIRVMNKDEIYVPEFDRWVKTLTSTMLFKPRLIDLMRQGAYTGFASLKFLTSLPFVLQRDLLAEIIDTIVNSQTQVSSFFSATALEDLIHGLLPSVDFEDLPIDLYITATDLDANRRAIFNANYELDDHDNHFITGVPLHKAVRASASIPGIFDPVTIQGREYVDGEVKRTLSADIGVRLADTIIVSHTYQPLQLPEERHISELGWWNILKQSGYIVFYERIQVWERIYREQFPDKNIICIYPDPDDETFFLAPQFSFRKEVQATLIASGEKAAQHALERAGMTMPMP